VLQNCREYQREHQKGQQQLINHELKIFLYLKVDLRAPTKPEAGVMATKPEMAPEQNPTADHFRSIR
jgi:hypothetical protein